LKDGGKLEGKIVTQSEKEVRVATKFGIQIIPADFIIKIEETLTSLEQYKISQREIQEDDAEGHYQLALWCKQNSLEAEYNMELRNALLINPNHEGVRIELGYVLYGGEWVHASKLKQLFKEKDLVAYKGRVITRSEYENIITEEAPEQPVSPDEENIPAETEVEDSGVPWDQAFKISSLHYTVKCNCGRQTAERYLQLMEQLYSEYRKVFNKFTSKQKARMEVWVFRNQEEFMSGTGHNKNVGGFYDPKTKMVITYKGSYGSTGNTDTVLAQQGCYQYLNSLIDNIENVPAWIVEGFAAVFEAYNISLSGRVTENYPPREILITLQEAIKTGKNVSIQEILRINRNKFTKPEEACAWGLVHYLRKSSSKNTNLLNKCLELAVEYSNSQAADQRQRGRPIPVARQFEETIGDIEEFEKRWKDWILRQNVPTTGKISGNIFKSSRIGFEITKPVKSTFQTTSNETGFQVSVNQNNSKLSVFVYSNADSKSVEEIVNIRERYLRQIYTKVEKGELTTSGRKTVSLTFSEQDKYIKTPDKNTVLKKYKYIFIATEKFLFLLILESDAVTFEENIQLLDQIATTLKIY
ncbi:MAG: hypothetical protein ABIH42_09960, partial [Planctomycetota bacterium]